MRCREEYVGLLDLYVRVVEATKGIKYDDDESWKGQAGPLAVKLAMHLLTILYLADGTRPSRIGNLQVNFVDHSSIKVLTRAALETFLAFSHLILTPETPHARRFRLRVWELGGLRERERFPATLPESKAVLERERGQLKRLAKQIEDDPIFSTLTPEERKRARRGEWRLTKQWRDLAVAAEINEQQFDALYRYLCSYAHSGSLSLLQIDQAADRPEQRQLSEMCFGTALMIMSRLVRAFVDLFPQAREAFEQSPEPQRRLVEIWFMEAALVAQFYDGDA